MVVALALAVPTSLATGLPDLPAAAAGTDVLEGCQASITAKYEANVLFVKHPLHGTVAKASARLRGDARAIHGAQGLTSTTAPAKLLVLVNGHAASRVPCYAGVAASCTVQVVAPQPSTVAVYLEDSSASNRLSCGPALLKVVNTADAAPTATASADVRPTRQVAPPVTPISSGPRVGILYEGWHAYAANAMAQVAAKGGQQLTVEQVIRGNGKYNLSEVWDKWGVQGLTDGFYYQSQPQLGFYCIYRARPGEKPIVPNCPNITSTLTTHARQLLTAGVDYVVTDGTNLGSPSDQADVLQVRPTEVLFEEWAALRSAGTSTPQIAVWQVITPGATLWQGALDLYNNASYADLVLTVGGKKVFFVPDNPTLPPDPTTMSAIESNGGRNDVTVVLMWADFNPDKYPTGMWGFFSPCRDTAGTESTSVAETTNCNQGLTTSSPLGTAMAVSPSYQINYGSVPFGAPGKLSGDTLRKQFATVLSAGPANVFISSFNEYIAQPQPNRFNSEYAFSMGTPWDTGSRASLWVDTYGWGFGRDIEPSVEGGSGIFDMMTSCLRVARLQAAFNMTTKVASGSGCTVSGELCCQQSAAQVYSNVWPLTSPGGDDKLLATSTVELAHLQSIGWKQHCNPYSGPTAFCVDASLLKSSAALQGPFLLHANSLPGHVPLYRCYTGTRHFFSPQSDCEGYTTESVLGYMSTTRSSDTPRGLRRCMTKTQTFYAVLDGACDNGDEDNGFYGFVV